jgi:hypothetical protein
MHDAFGCAVDQDADVRRGPFPGDIKTVLVLYFAIPAVPLALLDQRRLAGLVFAVELVALVIALLVWWLRRDSR